MPIKPRLHVFDATIIVVSFVIGIGIFRTPAIVARETGSLLLFLTAWITGGVISALGALTFAEIGARRPVPGAFYIVVAEAYHPSLAFMLNWTQALIVQAAGAAAVAMIGIEYLAPIILPSTMQSPATTQILTAAVTGFLLLLNYLGIRVGATAQNLFTVAKIGMMLVVIAAAFLAPGHAAQSQTMLPAAPGGWMMALAAGLISVFYTYGGYQLAINFGGDVEGAGKNIPRAIMLGMAVVVGVYVLINIAYIAVLGIEGTASASLVAADVARTVFGAAGEKIISVAIFLSAMGFLNVSLMQTPRTYYAMAEDGMMPSWFMRVNQRTQTQEPALLFFGATVLLSILLLGTFERLVNFIMLFDALTIAIVASTLFILRPRRVGEAPGLFRMPLYPVAPALFIAVLLVVTVKAFLEQPVVGMIGLGILLGGYPLSLLMRRLNKKQTPSA